jgi:hypothetical protein
VEEEQEKEVVVGTSKEEKNGKGWMVSPASWLLKGDTPPDLSQPHCEVGEDTLSSIDGSSMIGSSVSKYVSAIFIRIPSKCCFRYITESEEESSTDSDDEEAEPKLKYEYSQQI